MAKREKNEPQSQSQAGATNKNPNEDVADGNQSQVQPGNGEQGGQVGNNPTPGTSTPSDGGNPAANQGGPSSTNGGQ